MVPSLKRFLILKKRKIFFFKCKIIVQISLNFGHLLAKRSLLCDFLLKCLTSLSLLYIFGKFRNILYNKVAFICCVVFLSRYPTITGNPIANITEVYVRSAKGIFWTNKQGHAYKFIPLQKSTYITIGVFSFFDMMTYFMCKFRAICAISNFVKFHDNTINYE